MANAADPDDDARMLRALRVVDAVAESSLPLSLSQLGQRTDIPKATLARLVASLVSAAYLSYVPGRRELVPGPRAARLGIRVLGNGHFRRMCRAVLRDVVATMGETCNLTVRDGDCVMYIERVETDAPLRMHLEPGTRAPMHCTAGGKLFLAQMDAPERSRLVSVMKLERKTTNTIADPPTLLRELERLRKLGFGADNEEFVIGMVGIAIPVRDAQHGEMFAALVCHAASARASLSSLEQRIPILRDAARRLETLLNL